MYKLLIASITSIVLSFSALAEEAKQAIAPQKETAPSRPIVVELFTTQGCPSCPKADEFVAELVKDPALLPLSLHVDYWDNLGWKDPYSRAEFTERQYSYIENFGGGAVYTPQIVTEGRRSTSGNNRSIVDLDIREMRRQAKNLPITIKPDAKGKHLVVKISGAQDDMDVTGFTTPADILLVHFDRHKSNPVKNGENTGKILSTTNVVDHIDYRGQWNKGVVFFRVPLSSIKTDEIAVIVQQEKMGAVWGAARYAIKKKKVL